MLKYLVFMVQRAPQSSRLFCWRLQRKMRRRSAALKTKDKGPHKDVVCKRQTFNHRAHSRRRRIFFIALRFLFEAAKLQTKPKTSIEKPASEETESTPTPLSEPFAPSVEPESSQQTATKSREESGDHADIEKDAITGWREPEDSGSKAEVKRAVSRR